MSKQLRKYTIITQDEPTILNLSINTQVLSVINRFDSIVVYVLETVGELNKQRYEFSVIATGKLYNGSGKFLGTVPFYNAKLVLHIFWQILEI